MDYKYLFYENIPKGVKSIFVNGKKISREDFLKEQKKFFLKMTKLNTRVLIEVIGVTLISILLFLFFKK